MDIDLEALERIRKEGTGWLGGGKPLTEEESEELFKQLFGWENVLKKADPGQDTREEDPAGKDGGGEEKG